MRKRNPQSYLKFGTTDGASITVPAQTGKSVYVDAIHGATDLNHCLIEVTSPLSGTVATTSGSATVTGTGTDFINELYIGACIRVADNSEVLYVSSITSKTSFTATANASNNESSSTAVLFLASTEYSKGMIDNVYNPGFRSVYGKSITVNMTDSSSACSLGICAYNT
jgi:hypothetical protein